MSEYNWGSSLLICDLRIWTKLSELNKKISTAMSEQLFTPLNCYFGLAIAKFKAQPSLTTEP